MAIPEQFIDELVARSDIADVVSSYVHLTKKGGNLWGLCPFHSEKTPSFSVSPEMCIRDSPGPLPSAGPGSPPRSGASLPPRRAPPSIW